MRLNLDFNSLTKNTKTKSIKQFSKIRQGSISNVTFFELFVLPRLGPWSHNEPWIHKTSVKQTNTIMEDNNLKNKTHYLH